MGCSWLTFHTTEEDAESLIELQREWEADGIQKGIDRTRAVIAEANEKAVTKKSGGLVDLDVGAIMIREIIKPMIPAIQADQDAAVKGLSNKGSRSLWWWPILSLEAEKWAVITVRTVLTGLAPELRDVRQATPLALSIANHAKLQREFDLWKKAEAARKKERGDEYVDLFKLMTNRVKKVDARTVRKWMKLAEDADRLDWSKETKIHVGMKMLDNLVTHGGGWFEMVLVAKGSGRHRVTERQIRLTETAKKWIHKRNAVTELQRPFLAPMLCPPVPWRWEPDSQDIEGRLAE